MSTAGKVLVVLVTLALLGWIVLFSAVAERNANWGKKLQADEAKAEDILKKADAKEAEVEHIKVETTLKQAQMEKELVVLRSRLSDAEKNLAVANETNARYLIDKVAVDGTEADAKAAEDRWESDVAALRRQLAEVQTEVNRIKAGNKALADRYDGLQADFIKIKGQTEQAAKAALKASR